MKRMLFNATQEEELRVAMVDGQRLYDLNIELPASERKKANIYKGTITRVEPSLEAAFVSYGSERHGFLPLKEISSEYFVKEHKGGGKPNIREVLKEGQDIVVQIDKEERGNKGAALTTFVSLAGRFIVLKPNKERSGGVSRRIVGDDRDLARESLKEVEIPEGMSVILRTAGIDRGAEELEWDLNNLLAIWEAIKLVIVRRDSPFLIYRESDSVVRALRDYLTNEVGEILIDDEKAHNDAKEFIEQVMPHNLRKLKHYQDPVPLFTRYQIESQIESAFAHLVTLPSGGSMVIDHTEALVSIDINSARATKGGDIEATALQTNLEAADEVGRQLRLRDLGGLIVIDFIDMGPQKNQRAVETRLRDAVRQDRARVQIGKISRFGLMEMSRQRLRPSLGESSYLTCPRCSGVGTIRSVESLALAILRIIGEEARKERTAKVIAQLPAEVATYLLNEKRDWVQNVETRHEMQVILVANTRLETPHYQIRRVRDDQTELAENSGTSYELTDIEDEQIIPEAIQNPKPVETPAIASKVKTTPAPPRREPVAAAPPAAKKEPGLLSKIVGLFVSPGDDASEEEVQPARSRQSRKKSDGRSRGGQRNRRKPDAKKAPDGKKTGAAKKTRKRRSKKTSSDGGENESTQNKNAASNSPGDEDKQSESKPSGRRRSRGGRRRRRGSQDASETTAAAGATASTAADEQSTAPAADSSSPAAPNADEPKAKKKRTRRPRKPREAAQNESASSGDSSSSDSAQANPQEQKSSDNAAERSTKPTAEAKPASSESPSADNKASSKVSDAADSSQKERPADDKAPKAEARSSNDGDQGKTDKPRRKRSRKPADDKAKESGDVHVKSAQLESKPAESATPVQSTAKKPEKTQEARSDNGDAKSGDGPKKPAAPAADKPKGRLLPWEPQPDQPSSSKAPNPSTSQPSGDGKPQD